MRCHTDRKELDWRPRPRCPTRRFTLHAPWFGASVSTETSVLEAAEASSIQLPYECRSGICGQCKTRLTEGTVIMDSEDAPDPTESALSDPRLPSPARARRIWSLTRSERAHSRTASQCRTTTSQHVPESHTYFGTRFCVPDSHTFWRNRVSVGERGQKTA